MADTAELTTAAEAFDVLAGTELVNVVGGEVVGPAPPAPPPQAASKLVDINKILNLENANDAKD